MSRTNKHIDLMIVGAQKAGTTSLLSYLRDHSDICAHHGNEFSFFTDDKVFDQGYEIAFHTYFPKKDCQKIVAKNVTICSDSVALKRLREHNPEMKIIFLLREPTSRAYSSFNMGKSQGWVKKSFDDVVQTVIDKNYESPLYQLFISSGIYAPQLEAISKHFSPSQLRILLFEDLKNDSESISQRVFEWLGVSNKTLDLDAAHNVTTQSKSKTIAAFVNRLKSERNPVKRWIKGLLPYSFYSKLGRSIESLNETEARYDPISIEHKEILKAHFRSKNQKLQLVLSQEKYKESIEFCSKNNWLFTSTASS